MTDRLAYSVKEAALPLGVSEWKGARGDLPEAAFRSEPGPAPGDPALGSGQTAD